MFLPYPLIRQAHREVESTEGHAETFHPWFCQVSPGGDVRRPRTQLPYHTKLKFLYGTESCTPGFQSHASPVSHHLSFNIYVILKAYHSRAKRHQANKFIYFSIFKKIFDTNYFVKAVFKIILTRIRCSLKIDICAFIRSVSILYQPNCVYHNNYQICEIQ